MSDCRLRCKNPLFLTVLTIVSLICGLSYAETPDALPLDDPNAVIEKVISALKSVELPTNGRGTAVMLTENYREYLDNTELIVDFVFTERTSRTDIFEASGGITGSRLLSHYVSDKHTIKVEPSGAHFGKSPRHRDIGLDFHPEVFMQFKGLPLTKKLENVLKYMGKTERVSVEVDDKGIVHIVCRGQLTSRDGAHNYEEQMSFDTGKGLLPVLLKSTTEYPKKTGSTAIRLQWAQHDSIWYPSRAEYVHQPDNRAHRAVVIESFTPDVKDEEFILDWLDVPDGLNVSGAVKMRSYKSAFRSVEDPEIPLDEIDFVRKIRKRQSSLASKTEAGEAGGFYLRDYQTGRLIGPLSLKAGSLLPPLTKETYVVANPTASELEIRKRLLESHRHQSTHLDCELGEVVGWINFTIERSLGDKAPYVRVEDVEALITIEIGNEESAYDVLFRIAAKAKARVFIEDGVVVLSRRRLTELTKLDATTSETVARRGRPSP